MFVLQKYKQRLTKCSSYFSYFNGSSLNFVNRTREIKTGMFKEVENVGEDNISCQNYYIIAFISFVNNNQIGYKKVMVRITLAEKEEMVI